MKRLLKSNSLFKRLSKKVTRKGVNKGINRAKTL
jgi:hypothetical protein